MNNTAELNPTEMTDLEITQILYDNGLMVVPDFDEENIEPILVERTRQCLNVLGLNEYQVRTSGSFSKFGVCHYSWRYKVPKIVLTDLLFLEAKIDKTFNMAIETILHEVAHACRPKAAHKAPWKSLARELGCKPSPCRCYSDAVSDAIPFKFFLVVKKSGRIFGSMRQSKKIKNFYIAQEQGVEDQMPYCVVQNFGQGYQKVKERAEEIHQQFIQEQSKKEELVTA